MRLMIVATLSMLWSFGCKPCVQACYDQERFWEDCGEIARVAQEIGPTCVDNVDAYVDDWLDDGAPNSTVGHWDWVYGCEASEARETCVQLARELDEDTCSAIARGSSHMAERAKGGFEAQVCCDALEDTGLGGSDDCCATLERQGYPGCGE